MAKQFEDGEEDPHDFAAEIAPLEELAEWNLARFADAGSNPINVHRDRCIVVTDARSRFDDFLLNHA